MTQATKDKAAAQKENADKQIRISLTNRKALSALRVIWELGSQDEAVTKLLDLLSPRDKAKLKAFQE